MYQPCYKRPRLTPDQTKHQTDPYVELEFHNMELHADLVGSRQIITDLTATLEVKI
ncbi:hypothetical protein RE428_05620 [Marinobacter nanhaiticus D15-8W]|nr:hypothetical protein RE428_05620 [Marinobacter nanhaiticus D15-8W]